MSYDDTNKGVMFQPFKEQRMIGSGRLNIEGSELPIVVVRQPVKKGGDPVLVVYQKCGVLFPNDKNDNENAPDYSGPIDARNDLRIAAWKGEKDGNHYLSMKVSEKLGGGNGGGGGGGGGGGHKYDDDDIPF